MSATLQQQPMLGTAKPRTGRSNTKQDSKFIGILDFASTVNRPVGDIANPSTSRWPLRYGLVNLPASSLGPSDGSLLSQQEVIEVAQGLVDQGACALASAHSEFGWFQKELSQKFNIPIATSALLQWRNLSTRMRKGKKLGILTPRAHQLTTDYRERLNVPKDSDRCLVKELSDPSLLEQAVTNNLTPTALKHIRTELIEAVKSMQQNHPELACVILESPYMSPYRAHISQATGLEIKDICSTIDALALACGLRQSPQKK